MCFIDYKKAFDKVKHNEIAPILGYLGLDDKDLAVIQNVYFNQTAIVRTLDSESDEIRIEKGVRQDCVYSPDLFNLYSECIMKHLDDEKSI